MKFTFDFDTSNMTKEELLDTRCKLQTALDQVKYQLNAIAIADKLHLGPNIFFGITFDFAGMSKEELKSAQKEARHLMANFQRRLNHSDRKEDISKKFFGMTFNFSTLSKERLLKGYDEARALLRKIIEQLVIVEKLEGLSGQEDPH